MVHRHRAHHSTRQCAYSSWRAWRHRFPALLRSGGRGLIPAPDFLAAQVRIFDLCKKAPRPPGRGLGNPSPATCSHRIHVSILPGNALLWQAPCSRHRLASWRAHDRGPALEPTEFGLARGCAPPRRNRQRPCSQHARSTHHDHGQMSPWIGSSTSRLAFRRRPRLEAGSARAGYCKSPRGDNEQALRTGLASGGSTPTRCWGHSHVPQRLGRDPLTCLPESVRRCTCRTTQRAFPEWTAAFSSRDMPEHALNPT